MTELIVISSIFFIIAVLLIVFVIEKSKEKGKIPFDDRLNKKR